MRVLDLARAEMAVQLDEMYRKMAGMVYDANRREFGVEVIHALHEARLACSKASELLLTVPGE